MIMEIWDRLHAALTECSNSTLALAVEKKRVAAVIERELYNLQKETTCYHIERGWVIRNVIAWLRSLGFAVETYETLGRHCTSSDIRITLPK